MGGVDRGARRAAELDPRLIWAHAELGEALRCVGRLDEALAALDRALELDPGYSFALGTRGAVLWAARRYEGALACLGQALARDPTYTFARGVLGGALAEIGLFQAAADELARIDGSSRPAGWIWNMLGWALEHLGPERAAEAQRAYQAAIDEEPDALGHRKGVADALYHTDRPRAEVEYRAVIVRADEQPGDWDATTKAIVGWCHFRVGEYDRAIQLYVKSLSQEPSLLGVQFDFALALMCSDRPGLAAQEYKKGLEQVGAEGTLRAGGLLRVALIDLDHAISFLPELREMDESGRWRQALGDELCAAERTRDEKLRGTPYGPPPPPPAAPSTS